MRFRLCFVWIAFLLAAPASWTQQDALLSYPDAIKLFDRAVQLLDSTRVAVPELARAGAPVSENVRQAVVTLKGTGMQHAGVTYTFLANLRAYLALSDSVPKPFPFPEEARRQFAELRDTADRAESHFRALLDRKESQLRNPDRDNLARYAAANGKLSPPKPDAPRVVFLGDSITDGWRLNEYFPDRDFVNRGISGQITGEMLGRMKADVIDLKPSYLLVLAGTNDIARGVDVKTIQNNLTMIADLADAAGIRPLFASLLPVSDYHQGEDPRYEQTKRRPPATIRQVNTWIEGFCHQRGYPYVDYFGQLADNSGLLKEDSADDGLHPNGKGYRLMAPIALAAIDKEIKAAAGKKPKKRRFPFLGGE
jgi:lysophospholipase L1-like esterase